MTIFRKKLIKEINCPDSIVIYSKEQARISENNYAAFEEKVTKDFRKKIFKNYLQSMSIEQFKLNQKDSFFYFDCYVGNDGACYNLQDLNNKEFSIKNFHLMKRDLKKSNISSLNIEFEVKWIFNAFQIFQDKKEFETYCFHSFENILESKNDAKNFKILKKEIEILEQTLDNLNDDEMVLKTKFNLDFACVSFFNNYFQENLLINFKNTGIDDYEKKIKLRKNISPTFPIYQWSDQIEYIKNNVVWKIENGLKKFYKLISDKSVGVWDDNDWQSFELNSYAYEESYFKSPQSFEDNKQILENLQFFVEKNIGNKVILEFESLFNIPEINDYFQFEGIYYRVVKIVVIEEFDLKKLELHGIQIFEKIEFNSFENLDFKTEEFGKVGSIFKTLNNEKFFGFSIEPHQDVRTKKESSNSYNISSKTIVVSSENVADSDKKGVEEL